MDNRRSSAVSVLRSSFLQMSVPKPAQTIKFDRLSLLQNRSTQAANVVTLPGVVLKHHRKSISYANVTLAGVKKTQNRLFAHRHSNGPEPVRLAQKRLLRAIRGSTLTQCDCADFPMSPVAQQTQVEVDADLLTFPN